MICGNIGKCDPQMTQMTQMTQMNAEERRKARGWGYIEERVSVEEDVWIL